MFHLDMCSYSGGPRFECCPVHRLFRLRPFVVIRLALQ
jgi:hypothetical protein